MLDWARRLWSLDDLPTRVVPLSIDLAETTWQDLHGVCAAHPDLPVIVTRVNYRHERVLYPLFRHHPRLHVEISFF